MSYSIRASKWLLIYSISLDGCGGTFIYWLCLLRNKDAFITWYIFTIILRLQRRYTHLYQGFHLNPYLYKMDCSSLFYAIILPSLLLLSYLWLPTSISPPISGRFTWSNHHWDRQSALYRPTSARFWMRSVTGLDRSWTGPRKFSNA